MAQKIMTVCGPIKPEDLGITLPHEHILIDLRSSWKGTGEDKSNIRLFKKPVSLGNRGKIIYNTFNFIENMYHLNFDDAVKELKEFKKAGGNSIVDVTTGGIGRESGFGS